MRGNMIYSHIYKNKVMMFSPNSVELPGEKMVQSRTSPVVTNAA